MPADASIAVTCAPWRASSSAAPPAPPGIDDACAGLHAKSINSLPSQFQRNRFKHSLRTRKRDDPTGGAVGPAEVQPVCSWRLP